MTIDLHPHRYAVGMMQALRRIHHIVADDATSEFVRAHELAMPGELSTFCKRANDHLEGLIRQWGETGRVSYQIDDMVMFAHGEMYGHGEPIRLPSETVFLGFVVGDPDLELAEKGVFIEGCYLHELPESGEIEMTFVCQEPLWKEMTTIRYVEALVTASRIAIGRVASANTPRSRESAFIYAGLDDIHNDPALAKAVSLAVSALPVMSAPLRSHAGIRLSH